MNTSSQPSPLVPRYGKFPRWEAWVGANSLRYARLRHSHPPVVVRAATAAGLADKMTAYENARGGQR